MNSVRKGNDIRVCWAIYCAGQPYDLCGRNLRLVLTDRMGKTVVLDDYAVDGNVIRWTFEGRRQTTLGRYHLTLIENPDLPGMVTVDSVDFCELVPRSPLTADSCSCGDISVESVELESTLQLGTLTSVAKAKAPFHINYDHIHYKPLPLYGGKPGEIYQTSNVRVDLFGKTSKCVNVNGKLRLYWRQFPIFNRHEPIDWKFNKAPNLDNQSVLITDDYVEFDPEALRDYCLPGINTGTALLTIAPQENIEQRKKTWFMINAKGEAVLFEMLPQKVVCAPRLAQNGMTLGPTQIHNVITNFLNFNKGWQLEFLHRVRRRCVGAGKCQGGMCSAKHINYHKWKPFSPGKYGEFPCNRFKIRCRARYCGRKGKSEWHYFFIRRIRPGRRFRIELE